MNERERAEIVARAIDALLAGADIDASDKARHDQLQSLLCIAEQRLLGSMFVAKASLQHERDVWRSVLKRIQDAEIEAIASSSGAHAEDEDMDELAEVIAMRRQMAAEVSALGETYRQEVWDRVQSRLSQPTRHIGIPDILRPFRRRSDVVPTVEAASFATDPEPLLFPGGQPRRAMGPMAQGAQDMARARVWARMTESPGLEDSRIAASTKRRSLHTLSPLAFAAAAAAVIAVALGPLPATGFADHPATKLVNAISDYVGALDAAPPALTQLPQPAVVNATDATAAEASAAAGVTFREPSAFPEGFDPTASRFYSDGITGDGPATFALLFSSADASLSIYQEPAGTTNLAVGADATTRVALSDGTPATLVQGRWIANEGLAWSAAGAQSLVFERAGARVVIELSSASPRPKLLFQVADSLQ